MNKPYRIIKIGAASFGYVAFSVDHSRPEEYLPEVERELARKGYQGHVLFDLLLCNGPARNRFMDALFDGERFAPDSWRQSQQIDETILNTTGAFHRKNPMLLHHGVLTKAQRALVSRSVAHC